MRLQRKAQNTIPIMRESCSIDTSHQTLSTIYLTQFGFVIQKFKSLIFLTHFSFCKSHTRVLSEFYPLVATEYRHKYMFIVRFLGVWSSPHSIIFRLREAVTYESTLRARFLWDTRNLKAQLPNTVNFDFPQPRILREKPTMTCYKVKILDCDTHYI